MNLLQNRPTYLGGTSSSSLTDALSGGLSVSQPPRISLADDRFTLFDENGQKHPTIAPSLELQVIIVGGNPHVSRTYYAEGYDRDDTVPPVCWSDNGVGPSDRAMQPQHATCAGCPKAEWGKVNAMGNTVPWCDTRKKIAVLVAGAGETVYLLSVPPKSLKNGLQPYLNTLRENGADPSNVVTKLRIEDKVLKFDVAAWVPEAAIGFVRKVMDGDMPANVVGAHDRPKQAALAPPEPVRQLAPASAPEPSFGAAPEPERAMTAIEAEKVVRRGRPRARINETVVGPGPIPEATFGAPAQEIIPPQQSAGFITPQAASAPQASFGMQQASAPPADMNDVLTKAFGAFAPGR